ncbi:MAG: DNA-3-methyladenine glycosylase [Candidatus Aminicenantes bacterium]
MFPGFLNKPASEAAPKLLGCRLVHESPEGITSGKIVETEAYLENDPASHSHNGRTPRNEVMFGPSGRAYVYFTYGMHYCFNVVTGKPGEGEAVLIRALEPLEGFSLMMKRRAQEERKKLCSGPAKLVQAMGITPGHNGRDLSQGRLRLIDAERRDFDVVCTMRIGIKKGADTPLRFYIKNSPFVSRK